MFIRFIISLYAFCVVFWISFPSNPRHNSEKECPKEEKKKNIGIMEVFHPNDELIYIHWEDTSALKPSLGVTGTSHVHQTKQFDISLAIR